jgi:hypothetical protein
MTNEISVKQMCLVIRSGVEIWIDEEKANRIGNDLVNITVKFLIVEGRYINVADIVGIFNPQDLDEVKRRKMGQNKCKYGKWHGRDEECQCGRQTIPWEPPVINPANGKSREEFMANKEKLFGSE